MHHHEDPEWAVGSTGRRVGIMPIQNWKLTLSQLAIYFEGRLAAALDL